MVITNNKLLYRLAFATEMEMNRGVEFAGV